MEMFFDLSKLNTETKKLDSFKKATEIGVHNGLKVFGDRVEKKLKENLKKYGLGDSKIYSSINTTYTKTGVSIRVNKEYAMFVEYGTGIVGVGNPHPKPEAGWLYDMNNHGEKGWYYPTTSDDPNPHKHMYDGQLYGWTKGQASRPFMYETYLYAKRIFKKTINYEINKAWKGMAGVK